MNRKTFIFRALFIISLTSVILFGFEKFMQKTMDGVKYDYVGKINKVMQNKVNEDVIIWGASTAEGHFIPEKIASKTGLSTFNYGLTGTNIDQSAGLLEHYFLNDSTSKKVIIALDIHGGLVKRKQIFQAFNWLHVLNNEKIFESLYNTDTTLIRKAKYLPFYSLILYGKHNVRYVKKVAAEYEYPELGFEARSGTYIPGKNKSYRQFGESSVVYNKLKELCELGVAQNKSIYIVLTPCYIEGLEKGTNVESIVAKFKALENTGVTFMNYVDHPIHKDSKFFKDNTHLNQKGAHYFTELFSNDFKALLDSNRSK